MCRDSWGRRNGSLQWLGRADPCSPRCRAAASRSSVSNRRATPARGGRHRRLSERAARGACPDLRSGHCRIIGLHWLHRVRHVYWKMSCWRHLARWWGESRCWWEVMHWLRSLRAFLSRKCHHASGRHAKSVCATQAYFEMKIFFSFFLFLKW